MFYIKSLICVLSVFSISVMQGCGKNEDPKSVTGSSTAIVNPPATVAATEQFSSTITKSDLVGDWSALGGRGTIEALADGSFKITNENKNIDNGIIKDGVLRTKDWKVTGRLSQDKNSLIWSNGAIWKR